MSTQRKWKQTNKIKLRCFHERLHVNWWEKYWELITNKLKVLNISYAEKATMEQKKIRTITLFMFCMLAVIITGDCYTTGCRNITKGELVSRKEEKPGTDDKM